MKNWTKNNLGGFHIEAVDMGNNQQDIADWVDNYISAKATPETIQFMLDNADDYVTRACKAMGWYAVPQVGGLEVNIWE